MNKKLIDKSSTYWKLYLAAAHITAAFLLLPALVFSAPETVDISVTLNDDADQDRGLTRDDSLPASTLYPADATQAVFSALCPTLANQERSRAQENLFQLCNALSETDSASQAIIYEQISSKSSSANANISNLEQSGLQQGAYFASGHPSQQRKQEHKNTYHYQGHIPLYSFLGSSGNSDWDYFYKRINTFTSFDSSFSDREETQDDAGFESMQFKFLFGADFRINNTSLIGVAISLGRSETDLSNDRGKADSTSLNWTLFGIHQINKHWSLNGTFMQQYTDYDNTRDITINLPSLSSRYQLSAESSATQRGLLVNSDYQWSLPHAFELSLLNQINAVRTETDSYSEAGNTGFELNISAQEVNNITIHNGLELRKPMPQAWGILIPQLNTYWVHQFADQSRDIKATFIHDPQANLIAYSTQEGDSDYFTLQLGAVIVMPRGVTAFAQISSILGYEHYNRTAASIGLRGEF